MNITTHGRFVLKTFVDHLDNHLDGFNKRSDWQKYHLAELLFNFNADKRRNHRKYPGWLSITYQEIQHMFGRDFKEINGGYELFEVRPWAQKQSLTKAYRLTNKARNLVQTFLDMPLENSPLLKPPASKKGKARLRRTFPETLINTHCSNSFLPNPESLSSRKADIGISSRIDTNRESLNALIKKARDISRLVGADSRELDIAIKVRKVTYNTIGGKCFPQNYWESNTGRLYGRQMNLQNIPKVVLDAVLDGYHEYDFENCHFTILMELARRTGIECPWISYYLTNKKAVRTAIADEVELIPADAKFCLIAILYGATRSTHADAAIPVRIGTDKARVLYEQPFFEGIADDMAKARTSILAKWPDQTHRQFVNAVGKKIAKTEKPSRLLAHLLQGIESQMLRIAVRLFSDNIILLMHDGFSTSSEIDPFFLTEQIKEEAGFEITLSHRRHGRR